MAAIESPEAAATRSTRPCARIGCNTPAAAAFTFDASACAVWLDPPTEPNLGAGLLCEVHAERLTPPRGWTLQDRRATAPSLWVDRPTPTRVPTPPRPTRGRSAAARACTTATATAPLPFDAVATGRAASATTGSRWDPGARPGPELERTLAARTPLLDRAFEAARAPHASERSIR